jgi:hypothetical protein
MKGRSPEIPGVSNVADPEYLFRITDLGSRITKSRIPDPTTTKEGGKFVVLFFWNHKFHKILKSIFFEQLQKNLSQLTKNYLVFTQKKLINFQKNGLGIRDPEKNLSWRIQVSKKQGIPEPNPQYWGLVNKKF